jgi:uncharacterized heparinase superfamily protein
MRLAPPRRNVVGRFVDPARRRASLVGARKFRFLNEEHEINSARDWNNTSWPRLWLYNLHYFDDLNARDHIRRGDWHRQLTERWIADNPPTRGLGWDSYPISLRIVNWIKWLLAGNPPAKGMIQSLAVQARHLSRRLEFHLLGNHLIANAKALIFAGCFFEGSEAERWLEKGRRIVARQLKEQILADGGHFERSPMYHSLILEDLLDLINLTRAFDDTTHGNQRCTENEWAECAKGMRSWLKIMAHPDGEIALFNDAAFDIAPTPAALEEYARHLGLDVAETGFRELTHLRESGYLRLQLGPAVAFVDAAPIGPDYLPAHSHADTLSFELSLFDKRIVVDSGTSCYENNADRHYQRGTAAHNTVRIDRRDSSEVWGAFRVARRARPCDVSTSRTEKGTWVSARHDGYDYLPGKPRHCREWLLDEQSLQITDSIEGSGAHRIELFCHLHPDVVVQKLSARKVRLVLKANPIADLELEEDLALEVADSVYHPEFGLSIPNKKLIASAEIDLPARICTTLSWQGGRQ